MSEDDRHALLVSLSRFVGALVVLSVAAFLVLLVFPQAVGAEASYVVLSGSMAPAIDAGDVVVVQSTPADQIQQGDVITFSDAENPASTERTDRVTHRVIAVDRSGDTPRFRTKGDANEDPDPGYVTPGQVIGEVWFTIPLVGYAVVFAGTRLGTILLVVIPGALLILNELYSLYRDGVVTVVEAEDDGGAEEEHETEVEPETPSGDAAMSTSDPPVSESTYAASEWEWGSTESPTTNEGDN